MLQDLVRAVVVEQGVRAEICRAVGRRKGDVPVRLEVLVEISDQPFQARIARRADANLFGGLMGNIVFERIRGADTAVRRYVTGYIAGSQPGSPGFRGVLRQWFVPGPERGGRGSLDRIGLVFDVKAAEQEFVERTFGNIKWLVMGIGARVTVDIGQAARTQSLIKERWRDAQALQRLDQQAGAHRGGIGVVDIVIVDGHGRGKHIAARRAVRKRKIAGRNDDAIDPASVARVRADEAKRRDVRNQRQIHHAVLGMIEAAMIGLTEGCFRRGVKCRGIGRIRHDLDRAAHGTRPV